MSDREVMVEGGNPLDYENRSISQENVRPAWTRFKTKLGRATARRFIQRCQTIFSSTVNKCHQKFQNAQVNIFFINLRILNNFFLNF